MHAVDVPVIPALDDLHDDSKVVLCSVAVLAGVLQLVAQGVNLRPKLRRRRLHDLDLRLNLHHIRLSLQGGGALGQATRPTAGVLHKGIVSGLPLS